MSSPMSNYSRSQDGADFIDHFKTSVAKNDPRLEFHQDVIKDFGESYERAYQLWNTYYAEAYKDLSYYLGNQWSLEELSYLNNQRRSSFTYNKIRRLINLVYGYYSKNRMSSIVSPIEDSSEQTAEILTDALQYVMTAANGYQAMCETFKGALSTGMSFISPYLDYRDDPVSGDIKFHRDEWNAVILDPFFSKRDLSDCSFIARRKFLSRTEVISLLPDKEDMIKGLPWGTRDDKFTYMPYARQWGMQKLLNYTEYWRTHWETKEVLVDMETGETKEWNGDRKRLKLFRQAFPQLELIRKPVKSVEMGIIVEGELLYYGNDPWGLNDYPFTPYMAIFEPSYDLFEWKIQSLVRILRDPQTEINKRRSKMVDIIDNQLNSGWIAKTNSVSNPTSLYKTGQGQVIFMKPEAQMTDISKIPSAAIDPSQFQLEAEFEKDLFEILGLSPENVGMSENDKIETAGVLSKMRQLAGWIPMQDIFDGAHESQKIVSQKVVKLIQLNYTPEKIRKITKKEPTPEFFSQDFAKYNVTIEEGILTDTQKQSQFITLSALKTMGILPPEGDSLIIKNSNLHDKKELQDMMDQKAKAESEAMQQQQQMAMQQQAVTIEAIQSKSMSDRSLGHEREAKIQLDQALNAERISRSEEEKTAGVLNLIKAVKELQGMDLDHLAMQLQMVRELEGEQDAKAEAKQASETPAPAQSTTPEPVQPATPQ